MSKRTRQQAILELVAERRMPSQAALAKALAARGIDVTQATLSRDIAELRLVKTREGYVRPEDTSAEPAPAHELLGTLRRLVVRFDRVLNQVVLRTVAGGAQPVALALDGEGYEQLLGTIAGDDTVLAIAGSTEGAERLEEALREMLE
ncbi:MAG: ArgR family transcriptional regulator [Polyangia bacterium]